MLACLNTKSLSLLNDSEYLYNLNQEIKDYQCFVKDFLKRENIVLIVAGTDAEPHARVLSIACEKVNINYVVVAHGYISAHDLLSICPISASKLYVWSNNQKNDICKVCHDENKVMYLGYPGDIFDNNPKDEVVLFPFTSYEVYLNWDYQKVEEVKDIINKLIAKNYKIVYRFHPTSNDSEKQLLIKLFEINPLSISSNSLYTDIYNAKYVLGVGSSVLFQAKLSNIKTFQFESYSDIYDTECKSINSYNVINELKNEYEANENVYFIDNLKKFIIDNL